MDITAKEISDWALAELKAIHGSDLYENESAMYREMAILADVSSSTIRQFHRGVQPNLSTATLDKLVAALKKAKRLRAA